MTPTCLYWETKGKRTGTSFSLSTHSEAAVKRLRRADLAPGPRRQSSAEVLAGTKLSASPCAAKVCQNTGFGAHVSNNLLSTSQLQAAGEVIRPYDLAECYMPARAVSSIDSARAVPRDDWRPLFPKCQHPLQNGGKHNVNPSCTRSGTSFGNHGVRLSAQDLHPRASMDGSSNLLQPRGAS